MPGSRPEPGEAVDAAGSLDAPPIVLVHGSVVSRKMWLPQLRSLSSAHRVVAPDLPGHGDLADVPFTFAAAVETVRGAIARDAGGRALVVGLSLGGWVAIELAHRHPETVAGLVLVGCSRDTNGVIGVYLEAVSASDAAGLAAPASGATRREDPASLPARSPRRGRRADARGHPRRTARTCIRRDGGQEVVGAAGGAPRADPDPQRRARLDGAQGRSRVPRRRARRSRRHHRGRGPRLQPRSARRVRSGGGSSSPPIDASGAMPSRGQALECTAAPTGRCYHRALLRSTTRRTPHAPP